ncbi:hypothetical protein ACHAXM_000890 [Skeletonema potamos]
MRTRTPALVWSSFVFIFRTKQLPRRNCSARLIDTLFSFLIIDFLLISLQSTSYIVRHLFFLPRPTSSDNIMNLKLAILSFCAVATAARGHRIRANLDYHQFQFRATENALRRLLLESEESNRSNKTPKRSMFSVDLGGTSKTLNVPQAQTNGIVKKTLKNVVVLSTFAM